MKQLVVFDKFGEDKSLFALVIINLLPLLGVWLLGWSAMEVVMIYVSETAIIGVYNIVKMISAQGIQGIGGWVMKGFLVPFFCVHYYGFVFVQSMFAFILMSTNGTYDGTTPENFLPNLIVYLQETPGMMYNLSGIFLSHGISLFINYFGKEEYKEASPPIYMFKPYKRIFLQQIVVIFGAMLLFIFNDAKVFVSLLVVLKLVMDIYAHNQSHDKKGGINEIF